MITRDRIVDEIKNIPDESLDELYAIVKGFEPKPKNEHQRQNVLAALRTIKISASPGFSLDVNIYDVENNNAK